MTQIGFSLSEAHEALDDFLNGDRVERWIAAGDDALKEAMFPTTRRDFGDEVQLDLRRWAKLLRGDND